MNREPVTIVVESSRPEVRLDAFVRERLSDVSRGTIQRLIESGFIRVNGQHAKLTQAPRAGDRIEVNWPAPARAEARPQAIPLDILFEDEHLLLLNKPAGLVVHPSAGHDEGTLVNALLHHCEGQLSGIGGVARPGIVHRLDKDTSGCLVVAKTDAAHLALAAGFAGRDHLKVYLALVCGRMECGEGEINAAIARHPNHRKRMAVQTGGREARTSYKVRERWTDASWIEATLHTGRTHQIRVHFQHMGFPIVGDATYGKRANHRLKEVTGYSAPRQMLHAWRLRFRHPNGGRTIECEAPTPKDFEEAIKVLAAKTD